MSFLDTIAYFAQLNLQWFFFTLIGGVILGFGPATATLVQFLHAYREEKQVYSFKDFWHVYKKNFYSFSMISVTLTGLILLLLINLRIVSVFFKAVPFISPAYALLVLLILYITLLSFFTYCKADKSSFLECLKVGCFLCFRFPLQGFSLISAWYLLILLFSAKTSLFIVFGMSILLFLADFFHHQMIKKTKELKSKWS